QGGFPMRRSTILALAVILLGASVAVAASVHFKPGSPSPSLLLSLRLQHRRHLPQDDRKRPVSGHLAGSGTIGAFSPPRRPNPCRRPADAVAETDSGGPRWRPGRSPGSPSPRSAPPAGSASPHSSPSDANCPDGATPPTRRPPPPRARRSPRSG